MPKTWGQCKAEGLPGKCPWVSCRHHLALDVNKGGGIKVLGAGVWPIKAPQHSQEATSDLYADAVVEYLDAGLPTCSLEFAESGGVSQVDIAKGWGVSRQRVEQLENRSVKRLKRNKKLRVLYEELATSLDIRPAISPWELLEAPDRGDAKLVADAADKLGFKVDPAGAKSRGLFFARRKGRDAQETKNHAPDALGGQVANLGGGGGQGAKGRRQVRQAWREGVSGHHEPNDLDSTL